MLDISGKSITLTRGDTAYITFNARIRRNNELRVLHEGDTAVFRLNVPNNLVEIQCSVDVENNKILLTIEPDDTMNIPFGTYKYEVELITYEDEHFTFIADQTFTIGREYENHG